MKRGIAVWVVCLVAVMSIAAQGAPQKNRRQFVKPLANKPVAISEIQVDIDGGDQGGRSGGAEESWTLRPNGTVSHRVSLSVRDSMDAGDTQIPSTSGTFDWSDFAKLADYIKSSRLLDLKAPTALDDLGGSLNISLERGGQWKTIRIYDEAPDSAASRAGWVVLMLVRGMTAATDWKTPAGYSANTGLSGTIDFSLPNRAEPNKDKGYAFSMPIYLVVNGAGKEVGLIQMTNDSGFFRLVLPPGTYKLLFKGFASPGSDLVRPESKGYAWRAFPATVQVQAGSFAAVRIGLEKLPTAP